MPKGKLSFFILAQLLGAGPVLAQRARDVRLSVDVRPQCVVSLVSQVPGQSGPPGSQKSQVLTFAYGVRTSTTGGGQIISSFGLGGEKEYPPGSKIDYSTQLS